MRKIASIGLLCCLLVYIGGYHLVFALHQYGLKQEMRAYLATHPDIRYGSYFSLPIKDGQVVDPGFNWEEESEEFRYHDELYDVVAVHQQNDTLRISALKDDNENNLEQHVKQLRHDRHNSSAATVSAFKFNPVICLQAGSQNVAEATASQCYAVLHSPDYASAGAEVQTPPPRRCS